MNFSNPVASDHSPPSPARAGQLGALFGVLTCAGILAYSAYRFGGLNLVEARTLFVVAAAVGLWVTEAIAPFAVSLAVVAANIFFLEPAGMRGSEQVFVAKTQAWSSPVIWLILGGFVLALGMSETKLDQILARRMLSLSRARRSVFLAIIIGIAAVLSMFMSNTATTALLVSIVSPLIRNDKLTPSFGKATLLGIAGGATVGGMGTIIGSSPNALALAYFSDHGIAIDFLTWMKVGAPLVLMILLPVFLVLKWTNKVSGSIDVSVLAAPDEVLLDHHEAARQRQRRWIVIGTFMMTIVLWVSSPLHSWSIAAIAFLPIVVFSVTGIMRDHHIRSLPWDTLLFVMGGVVLGQSVSDSGLAASVVKMMPLEGSHPTVVLLGLAYLTMLLSNVLSNTATAALLIPLGSAILPGDAGRSVLVIAMAASTSLFLPISTPTNAVVYATQLLGQRDFRLLGLTVGLIGPPLIVMTCLWLG